RGFREVLFVELGRIGCQFARNRAADQRDRSGDTAQSGGGERKLRDVVLEHPVVGLLGIGPGRAVRGGADVAIFAEAGDAAFGLRERAPTRGGRSGGRIRSGRDVSSAG